MRYTVLVHPDREDGGFFATVPAVPGVVGQGETADEALRDTRESLSLMLDYLAEEGKEAPPDVEVSATRKLEMETGRVS